MRKQVQKERCTKIMLTKCKAVCHLYDKVQLAAAKINYNNSDNGRVRVDRYFYMYTFKGATQCNTIIIPVRMSLIPAYHRAEKCQSAKPVLGATLQTAKSRTMAVVTQATTAILFHTTQ